MVVTPELRAQILRLYLADQWRVGTIARQLQLHRDTVGRVLAVSSVLRAPATVAPRLIDPFMPFIQETLAKFPTLAASRLYAMVQERGYGGGSSHFRHMVAPLRPRPAAEAYLRLRTLAGEQAQVDWAHMGYVMVGKAKRPLMAFVMVLSYSRRIFLHFSLNAQMDSFLRGHVLAFEAWGGVPRVILSDNLKSAVLERVGDAIRFNPQYLAFAAHYRFEPRPVAVARGNEKGRVERSIRYIRDNFFAARVFTDVADLNAQAKVWTEGPASTRPWPEGVQLTVAQAFVTEQPKLMALPMAAIPSLSPVPVSMLTKVSRVLTTAGCSAVLALNRASSRFCDQAEQVPSAAAIEKAIAWVFKRRLTLTTLASPCHGFDVDAWFVQKPRCAGPAPRWSR